MFIVSLSFTFLSTPQLGRSGLRMGDIRSGAVEVLDRVRSGAKKVRKSLPRRFRAAETTEETMEAMPAPPPEPFTAQEPEIKKWWPF